LWQGEREINWRGSDYWCWIWVWRWRWRWGEDEFVEGGGAFVEGESSVKGVTEEDEFVEDKEYAANSDNISNDYTEYESDFKENWNWTSVIPKEIVNRLILTLSQER